MKISEIIPALQHSDGKLITISDKTRVELYFKHIYPYILKAAKWLSAQGYDDTCTFGIIAKNSLDWVIADLACICCGIKVLAMESDREIGHFLDKDIKFSAILFDQVYADGLSKIEQQGIRCILLSEFVRSGGIETSQWEAPHHDYAAKEVFSFRVTSGSMGSPKVIGQTVESVENSIQGIQDLFKHRKQDKILVFLPLNLVQQRYWLYSAIMYEFTVIIMPRNYVFAAIKEEAPTVIMGVPFIYECIQAEFLRVAAADLTLQQFLGGRIDYLWTGSAPISNAVLDFYSNLGITIYQGYGMNETCIIAKNFPGNNKIGSVGKLFPNIEIKFDSNSQILVKNKYPVCTYYTVASEEDKNIFRNDGYIETGDIGHMDEEGYLYIDGRIKEMIALSSSKKVFPAKIEEKLRSYTEIKHCVVYGDQRPYLTALVIPTSQDVKESAIKAIIERYNNCSSEEEQIYRFFTVYADYDDLLSGQEKIRRKTAHEKYSAQFQTLYSTK